MAGSFVYGAEYQPIREQGQGVFAKDLMLPAPHLQAEVLELEAVDGLESMSVRTLQAITRADTWPEQRDVWRRVHEKTMLNVAGAITRHTGRGRHLLRAAGTLPTRESGVSQRPRL